MNDYSILQNSLEPFILNTDTVHEIIDFPILLEGILYQPEEYIGYVKDGFEIALYLILGLDEQENEILYSFKTSKEAKEFIRSISDTNEKSSSFQTRKAGRKCYKPYNWRWVNYPWWRPHWVFSFHHRPSRYKGYMTNLKKYAGWKQQGRILVQEWESIPDIKVPAVPLSDNNTEVLVQWRDVIKYCSGNGWKCLKHFQICQSFDDDVMF